MPSVISERIKIAGGAQTMIVEEDALNDVVRLAFPCSGIITMHINLLYEDALALMGVLQEIMGPRSPTDD